MFIKYFRFSASAILYIVIFEQKDGRFTSGRLFHCFHFGSIGSGFYFTLSSDSFILEMRRLQWDFDSFSGQTVIGA